MELCRHQNKKVFGIKFLILKKAFRIKMKKLSLSIIFLTLCLAIFSQSNESYMRLGGQLSTWAISQVSENPQQQIAVRILPQLQGKHTLNDKNFLDFEASAQGMVTLKATNFAYDTTSTLLKPYRLQVRWAGQQHELIAGLQKINFGAAKMFRPLMWFDGMDVRDPLQLSNGVNALLGKYFFENNAAIWAWTVMGNNQTKGWESIATKRYAPEFGLRLEQPFSSSEIGLSTHHRTIEPFNTGQKLKETKMGIDAKWDLGLGLWIENSTTITEQNALGLPHFAHMLNIGIDYTFDIGNGLGLNAEFLHMQWGDKFLNKNVGNLIGTSFNYPLSIIDQVSAIFFYVPKANMLFNYLSWNRTYDKWSIHAIAFWNPENMALPNLGNSGSQVFSGKGLQVLAKYEF